MKTGKKPQQRGQSAWSRDYERRLIASGSRRMPGGILPPEGAIALDALMYRGYETSNVRCVTRALIEATKRNKTRSPSCIGSRVNGSRH